MGVLSSFQLIEVPRTAAVKYDLSRLADFVVRERRRLGLSLEKVRDRNGPSTGWLSSLENGTMIDLPKRPTLEKLADALGADIEEVMALAGYHAQRNSRREGANHGMTIVSGIHKNPKRPENGVTSNEESDYGSGRQASEGAPGGIPTSDDAAERGEALVPVQVYGPASCGDPHGWPTDEPVETLYLPQRLVDGVDFGIRVDGNSMSGYGIMEGDTVMIRRINGERVQSGKPVVLCVDGCYAVKMLRRDDTREFLEEYRLGQGPREVEFSKGSIYGVVVRSVSTKEW